MADTNAEVVACANPDCQVEESGRCVEGFELQACPHYGRNAKQGDDGETSSEAGPIEIGEEGIRLPAGDTLLTWEASALLRAGDARVIAILGPSDAGKTSLIASLYDLFQEGPVTGIGFGRSRTLHAFEHTCHDARAASRRGEPHMTRTPRGEVRFYHLEIASEAAGDRLALLLADRAGEEYREVADDPSIAASLPEIVRADSITILVDGERLLDSGARHNLRSEIIMMLQGLRDGDGLQEGLRLALVLTKLDTVRNSQNAERATRDFIDLLGDVRRLFGEIFSEIEPFQTAASPKTGALARGTGLPELLSFWLQRTAAPAYTAKPNPRPERAFARLTPLDERLE